MSILTPGESFTVTPSDIVSISIINEYDTNTYPIVRIRLYTDISTYHTMIEYPHDISVNMNLDGGIYKMAEQTDESRSPQLVRASKSINISMQGYIEKKNAPSSKFDDYENGIKKNNSLNTSVKVPIELYGYNELLTHKMRQRVQSVYKDLSLQTTLENCFRKNGILDFEIETIQNAKKWNQILIPNLSCRDAVIFLDTQYGLYDKGGLIFGDWDGIKVCSSNVDNGKKTIPIYVDSKDSNSDMSGMQKYGDTFMMVTQAPNVNVLTETDIERVFNSYYVDDINLDTHEVNIGTLKKLYSSDYGSRFAIRTIDRTKELAIPDILHKSSSPYVVNTYIARLIENVTRVDVSGAGFDITQFTVDNRFNLIFKSPIRGVDMNTRYRARYVNHVLGNIDSDLFSPTTTLSLCSN